MKTFRTFFEDANSAQDWEIGRRAHLASQPVSREQRQKAAIQDAKAREKRAEQWKEMQRRNAEQKREDTQRNYQEFLMRQRKIKRM